MPTFRRQTEGRAGFLPAAFCLENSLSSAPPLSHGERVQVHLDEPRNEERLLLRRRRLDDQSDMRRDLVT